MNIEEIKAFIETNKDNEEVKGLLNQFQTPITIETAKKFMETEADGIAFMQSYADKRVTDGIKTFKANNLQKLIEEEMAKRNPQKTPEEIRIEELERRILENEKQSKIKDLKLKFTNTLAEKNMLGFADYLLVGEDDETVQTNIEKFEGLLKPLVQSLVDEKLKATKRTPPKDDKKGNGGRMTRAELMKMPLLKIQEFKAKNPELYKEIMTD